VTVRRMMPDERRALILRAARDLFSQRPYAEVPVADIARAAGVSPPLIVSTSVASGRCTWPS
jgi:AcrR family transcriptional regulator